jgi:xanthine dehydrogenase small subunit
MTTPTVTVNGEQRAVTGVEPHVTALDWLRDQGLTGAKEGCAEGECGACSVLVARPDGAAPDGSGRTRWTALNACLVPALALDGQEVVTAEGLGRPSALHPVQREMAVRGGSQCGYCTPGFICSMAAEYYRPDRAVMDPATNGHAAGDGEHGPNGFDLHALSGNLCRCTGYRPILDAGQRMFELAPAALDTAPVVAALEELRNDPVLAYAAGDARFEAPRTLDELAAARLARPGATLLSGSTDIGLWVTKMFRDLPDLIYVGEVAELKRIERRGDTLRIGAGASLEEAYRALVLEWPSLEDVWLRFASVPIRNAGTMGGNIANGSPIGDSAPVLMALDASIELRRGAGTRTMALTDFYVDYMKNRLEPGEFVEALSVPVDHAAQVRAYKMSKRFDCDISAVCAGLAIELDGDAVAAARFAFGGMAATVRRAAGAEAAVVGRPWSEATLQAAQRALAEDFKPLTDMRASAAYRTQVSQNLLRRFWLETRTANPLGAAELSVWNVMPHATIAAAGGST